MSGLNPSPSSLYSTKNQHTSSYNEFNELQGFRPDLDKPCSPAASYKSMASDRSMTAPPKFSQDSDVMNLALPVTLSPDMVDPASPAASSVKSDESAVSQTMLRNRESYTSLLMREHLRCSVCKEMLREPVTIPCGHSFCNACILSYWAKPAHSGSYPCPQCRKRFKTRPALTLNYTLANIVQTQQQAGFSSAVLSQSYSGPEDVACDVCSGSKVNSCQTCCASDCKTNMKRRYPEDALNKHALMEPTKDVEQGVCKLGTTKTPAEQVIPMDQMSTFKNQMTQLQNQVNEVTVKMKSLERSLKNLQCPKKRKTAKLKEQLGSLENVSVVPEHGNEFCTNSDYESLIQHSSYVSDEAVAEDD